jgi:hypothetical protein
MRTISFIQVAAYVLVGGVAFVVGYVSLINQNEVVSDISPNQVISTVCQNQITQSANSTVSGQDKLPSKDVSATTDMEKLKQELSEAKQKNHNLEKELAELKQASLSIKNIEDPVVDQCASLSETVELGLSQEAMKGIYNVDYPARKRSLLALAQLNNTNAREIIGQVIFNEQEDSSLRQELIRSTDMTAFQNQLPNALSTIRDEMVRISLISSVNANEIDPNIRSEFEDKLIDMFGNDGGDSTSIAIVDYFSNFSKEKLRYLSQSGRLLSDPVKNHLMSFSS